MKRMWLLLPIIASIATSRVFWDLPAEQAFAPATLDDATPSARYIIHTEVRGSGKYEDLYGDMTITINSTVPGVMYALTDLTPPEDQSTTGTLSVTAGNAVSLSPWSDCSQPPCSEDFELVLTRAAGEIEPVQITGSASVIAHAGGTEPPAGTEVFVTIEGPL